MIRQRLEVACADCGYRARVSLAPPFCPHCRGASWEHRGMPLVVPAAQKGRRVLVEDADATRGIAIADALVDAGYAVATCPGPTAAEPCPLLTGDDCTLAAGAGAIVSNLDEHEDGIAIGLRLRERYRAAVVHDADAARAVGAVTHALAR